MFEVVISNETPPAELSCPPRPAGQKPKTKSQKAVEEAEAKRARTKKKPPGAEVAAHVRGRVEELARERKAKVAAEKKAAANELKKAAPAPANKRPRRRR